MNSAIMAVMLVFVTSFGGESTTFALKFDTISTCQKAKPKVIKLLSDNTKTSEEKDKIDYIVAVCLKPMRLVNV